MRLRERFGKRGGWKTVRDFMAAYERPAPFEELLDLKRQLHEKLQYCFKPVAAEFGVATIRFTKALAKIHPTVHKVSVALEVAEAVKPLAELMREMVTYFRGDYRRGKKGAA